MKKSYYIDYPQEHVEGQAYTYRCVFCKLLTTKINGNLDGHLPNCDYRIKLEREGFENSPHANSRELLSTDSVD